MVFLGRALMTFLHEMGHGIMAAAFTKGKISLYLGTHDKTKRNLMLTAGRFTFHIKHNIFAWNGGLCSSNTPLSLSKYILLLLAGAIFPVIIAVGLFFITQASGSQELYKAATFFLICCIIFVPVNLFPYTKPINLITGKDSYNDGHLIITAINYRRVHREYALAMNHYRAEEYTESAEYFKILLANGKRNERIQRLAIGCFGKAKQLDALKSLLEDFSAHFKASYVELINFGYYYSQTDDHDKALEYFNKSLSMNDSFYAHYNIGYTMIVMNRYDEAIAHLDKAIALDPKQHAPYCNRGLAKIKLGNAEQGLSDLEFSFSLDPENAYYYKNMGTYHFDRKEYLKALEYFETALEKDPSTHKIQEDITAAREALKEIS
ncbi:tetratricopeptide repeat protein [Flavobacterium sp. MFBS3-15]|uniref:tetratricopeptide repeat protein n=1 Tax=Flavobacterium sp. MFBS3-15 TaxID=2989816 RepID=UPI0022362CC7|nr:tetratricopeptide repeat protein [Flavobacterium sp. MFBS3-15]MCW4467408.1 tetratricopeptide repeat protein [Flavobacterium sp. MFBS3-15]